MLYRKSGYGSTVIISILHHFRQKNFRFVYHSLETKRPRVLARICESACKFSVVHVHVHGYKAQTPANKDHKMLFIVSPENAFFAFL